MKLAPAVHAALESALQRIWWSPRPGVAALLLAPLAALYGWLWRRRVARAVAPAPLRVPVLVVGNCVVGGAGKTPAVIAIVSALRQRGHRPGIVSRGHGRRGVGVHAVAASDPAAQVGDEPLLLARRTGVPVTVGRDRHGAATALLQDHPDVDVLVSDDGLQHLALPRSAELVVFDERGAGNGMLLPAGPLREPLPDRPWAGRQVLYTSGHRSTSLPGLCAQRTLRLAWPLAAWQATDASLARPLESLRGRPLLAVAGIAAPDKFFGMLRAAGLSIDTLPLADHHDFADLPWTPEGPDIVLTEKDAVKLHSASAVAGRPIWVLPLDLSVPEELLDILCQQLFGSSAPPHARNPQTP